MEMMLVRTTVGTEAEAAALARRLIDAGAACCVHMHKIRSVYRWQARVEDGEEWSVEARTPEPRAEALFASMQEGHPYDTPLVEAFGPTRVPAGYARWAAEATLTGG